MIQGLYVGLLHWLARSRPAFYARHRTPLVVAALLWHVMVSKGHRHSGPGCLLKQAKALIATAHAAHTD